MLIPIDCKNLRHGTKNMRPDVTYLLLDAKPLLLGFESDFFGFVFDWNVELEVASLCKLKKKQNKVHKCNELTKCS